jgi:hypothetical protein
VPVAHTYNPKLLRGIADQSQPRHIVCKTLSQNNPSQKKGWWGGSRCRPSVQIPLLQKKKKVNFSVSNIKENSSRRKETNEDEVFL